MKTDRVIHVRAVNLSRRRATNGLCNSRSPPIRLPQIRMNHRWLREGNLDAQIGDTLIRLTCDLTGPRCPFERPGSPASSSR